MEAGPSAEAVLRTEPGCQNGQNPRNGQFCPHRARCPAAPGERGRRSVHVPPLLWAVSPPLCKPLPGRLRILPGRGAERVPGMAGPGPGRSPQVRARHERDAVALGAQQQRHEAGKEPGTAGNSPEHPGTARNSRGCSRDSSSGAALIAEREHRGWPGAAAGPTRMRLG